MFEVCGGLGGIHLSVWIGGQALYYSEYSAVHTLNTHSSTPHQSTPIWGKSIMEILLLVVNKGEGVIIWNYGEECGGRG